MPIPGGPQFMQVQMHSIHLDSCMNPSGPWRIHLLTWQVHLGKAPFDRLDCKRKIGPKHWKIISTYFFRGKIHIMFSLLYIYQHLSILRNFNYLEEFKKLTTWHTWLFSIILCFWSHVYQATFRNETVILNDEIELFPTCRIENQATSFPWGSLKVKVHEWKSELLFVSSNIK